MAPCATVSRVAASNTNGYSSAVSSVSDGVIISKAPWPRDSNSLTASSTTYFTLDSGR